LMIDPVDPTYRCLTDFRYRVSNVCAVGDCVTAFCSQTDQLQRGQVLMSTHSRDGAVPDSNGNVSSAPLQYVVQYQQSQLACEIVRDDNLCLHGTTDTAAGEGRPMSSAPRGSHYYLLNRKRSYEEFAEGSGASKGMAAAGSTAVQANVAVNGAGSAAMDVSSDSGGDCSAVVLEELQQLMNVVVSLIASHSPQIDQAQLPTDPAATAGDVWMLGGQYVSEMWRHLGLDEGSDSPEPVVELDMRVRHGQCASDVLLLICRYVFERMHTESAAADTKAFAGYKVLLQRSQKIIETAVEREPQRTCFHRVDVWLLLSFAFIF
jgi:hypothetical protein